MDNLWIIYCNTCNAWVVFSHLADPWFIMIYCQRIFSAVFPEQEILPSLIRAQGFPAEVGKPEVDGAMCGQPSWGQGPAPMSYDVILLEVTLLGNWEMQSTFTSGWWFGTFWIFPYIGNVIIPIDVHIFQRGRYTTNQWTIDSPLIHHWLTID